MAERVPFLIVAGVLGAGIGSFLNVVVYRVPRNLSLVRPGSACTECKAPIKPYDNIPIISYVLLRGRCRECRAHISIRYPIIEFFTAALFVGAFVRFERIEEAIFVCAASAVLLAMAFIDLEHRRVPNKIVLPGSAVAAVWVIGAAVLHSEADIAVQSLISGAAGFAILFVIAVVSGGMGFGDVKLAMFIGLVTGRFGWPAFVLSLFSGFVFGGLVAVALLVTRRSGRKDAIPFAPMLCLGALVGLFAGDSPVRVWMGI